MWQALPAVLLPRPGFMWEPMTAKVKGGKQRLHRHLVNLWELLQSYQTKRGLVWDKRQRAHSDTRFPSKHQADEPQNTLQMRFTWDHQINTIESEGKCYTCVTACSHSTSATGLQGVINKMHQQHRYGQVQCVWRLRDSLFTAVLRQLHLTALNHQCGRTFTNKANAKSSVCVLIKFKFPWGAVRHADGKWKEHAYLVYFFQFWPLLLL